LVVWWAQPPCGWRILPRVLPTRCPLPL
jgi:hypothetical protein